MVFPPSGKNLPTLRPALPSTQISKRCHKVIWNPYHKGDINKIESVHRYFTKRLGGLFHKTYNQRMAVLNLDSLHLRRIKADLLLCYKMINNRVDVDVSAFFTLSDCELTRSNGHKLKKSHWCDISVILSLTFEMYCHPVLYSLLLLQPSKGV